MATTNVSIQSTIGGVSYASINPSTAYGVITHYPATSIAAAKAGVLTTRTDNDTGSLTMSSGHGIETGDRLDVHWVDADGVNCCRRGMTVGTVATNVVPIDGGVGDNLPAAAYTIAAMVPVSQDVTLDAAELRLVAASIAATSKGCIISLADGTAIGDELACLKLNYGIWGDTLLWDGSRGATCPAGSDPITKVYVSHGDIAAARTFKMTFAGEAPPA